MIIQGQVQLPRGVATTEYLILLLAIGVILISVVVNLGGTVHALWGGALSGGLDDLATHADDMSLGLDCPYVYNEGTERWHDPANGHSFVSFEEASTSGCS